MDKWIERVEKGSRRLDARQDARFLKGGVIYEEKDG